MSSLLSMFWLFRLFGMVGNVSSTYFNWKYIHGAKMYITLIRTSCVAQNAQGGEGGGEYFKMGLLKMTDTITLVNIETETDNPQITVTHVILCEQFTF